MAGPGRRQFLLSSLGLVSACTLPPRQPSAAPAPEPDPDPEPRALREIEEANGVRLGVFALETSTGRSLEYRADERFAMCSTFKWVLAAAVLARVDRGESKLDEQVAYGPADLLEYAPVTSRSVGDGFMTVEALTAAAVTVSDNTAANLLLAKVGGPAGLTQFARAAADTVTRLDRLEPELNENVPGDPRDTTSPRAMVGLMRRLLGDGEALSGSSRELLKRWLQETETGKKRLRAGFPPNWTVGDKTGSGRNNAVNDVAIATPPGGAPIFVAAYMSGGSAALDALEAAHADIAGIAVRELGRR